MKIKFTISAILAIILATCPLYATGSNPSQTNFDSFWTKIKTAVTNKDKATVLRNSKLPFYMPYGQRTIRTRSQFLKTYNHIFNGEANAAKCFASETPQKVNSKRYEVACGFKDDATGDAGKPVVYAMELTRNGWKLAGLDNINE